MLWGSKGIKTFWKELFKAQKTKIKIASNYTFDKELKPENVSNNNKNLNKNTQLAQFKSRQ